MPVSTIHPTSVSSVPSGIGTSSIPSLCSNAARFEPHRPQHQQQQQQQQQPGPQQTTTPPDSRTASPTAKGSPPKYFTPSALSLAFTSRRQQHEGEDEDSTLHCLHPSSLHPFSPHYTSYASQRSTDSLDWTDSLLVWNWRLYQHQHRKAITASASATGKAAPERKRLDMNIVENRKMEDSVKVERVIAESSRTSYRSPSPCGSVRSNCSNCSSGSGRSVRSTISSTTMAISKTTMTESGRRISPTDETDVFRGSGGIGQSSVRAQSGAAGSSRNHSSRSGIKKVVTGAANAFLGGASVNPGPPSRPRGLWRAKGSGVNNEKKKNGNEERFGFGKAAAVASGRTGSGKGKAREDPHSQLSRLNRYYDSRMTSTSPSPSGSYPSSSNPRPSSSTNLSGKRRRERSVSRSGSRARDDIMDYGAAYERFTAGLEGEPDDAGCVSDSAESSCSSVCSSSSMNVRVSDDGLEIEEEDSKAELGGVESGFAFTGRSIDVDTDAFYDELRDTRPTFLEKRTRDYRESDGARRGQTTKSQRRLFDHPTLPHHPSTSQRTQRILIPTSHREHIYKRRRTSSPEAQPQRTNEHESSLAPGSLPYHHHRSPSDVEGEIELGVDYSEQGGSEKGMLPPASQSKYITRAKMMDTSSLATADPAVWKNRLEHHASSPAPPYPSGEPNPATALVGHVTYEDWEDLKEVWARCLEVVDVKDPAETLPLLRGIIHECSRFLQVYEDPSVLFYPTGANSNAIPDTLGKKGSSSGTSGSGERVDSGVGTSDDSDHDKKGKAKAADTDVVMAPPYRSQSNPPQSHPSSTTPGNTDLPTAFHSLLGTALFLFGNLIGSRPDLALPGEPNIPIPYHLYAVDVFEMGEEVLGRVVSGLGNRAENIAHSSVKSFSSSENLRHGASSTYTYAPGMKEDWYMAITWGRALLSLADELLTRQRAAEELKQTATPLPRSSPGYFGAGPVRRIGLDNPASFLSEDVFAGISLQDLASSTAASDGYAYFNGTGGAGMGLRLDARGAFVSDGRGASVPSAFFSYSYSQPNSDESKAPTPGLTQPMSTLHVSSPFETPEDPRKLWTRECPFVIIRNRIPTVTRRMTLGGVGSGRFHSTTGSGYGGYAGAATENAAAYAWLDASTPGVSVTVDELVTLAVDQFSRGILHMPRTSSGPKHYHHVPHVHASNNPTSSPSVVVSSTFSRASHLFTIALEVLILAEKLDHAQSRYKWARYADSVFEQMKLEENPAAAVVTLASASFAGALNSDMPFPYDDARGRGGKHSRPSSSKRGKKHSEHHHHHHHHHKHHKHDKSRDRMVEDESSGVTQGQSSRGSATPVPEHAAAARPAFLNHNTNPVILKARGRCALILGSALSEEHVEPFLEGGEGDDVTRVLQSEEAEEARERLTEAVSLFEKTREVLDVSSGQKKDAEERMGEEPSSGGDAEDEDLEEERSELKALIAEALVTLANLVLDEEEREKLYQRAASEGVNLDDDQMDVA